MLDSTLALIALALALALRPWRLFAGRPALVTPLLATLAILPWLWALPALLKLSPQLQWSGAVLVLLMLGWPIAVPVLLLVALLACLISPLSAQDALAAGVWQGIVPATLALFAGAAVRRWLPSHAFVYILGRGFASALLCLFAARLLAQHLGAAPAAGVGGMGLVVAQWLMAWGDAFVTGMLTAIFVAFKPEWLLTWSDAHYLRR
ncbi:hypothetical protein [Ramlibacter alkalitolerans]|uniref:Uncharacterized protein n=1 Tax=Ramlibacter alkalitolerans TaxID=2039631 RepID=A0ABS1JVP5_9BURK|nr:hypothetical protein [Ramlibacter alkalitolerans]MBL0428390.1 hypothetical protein [Ramlibacter alkalitolerans]